MRKLIVSALVVIALLTNALLLRVWIFCPRIELSSQTIDVDVIANGSASTQVIVSNKGHTMLRIGKVTASCGCSKVIVGNKDIKAGDASQLTLTLSGKDIRQSGIVATVTIESNDPYSPVVQLPVIVHAIDGMFITPSVVDFGRISINDLPVTRSVYVKADLWSDAERNGIAWSTPAPWLQVELGPAHKSSKETKYEVKIVGPIEAGSFHTVLKGTLAAADESRTVITRDISILGEVRD